MYISTLLFLGFVAILHGGVYAGPDSWFKKIIPSWAGGKAANTVATATTPLEEDEYGILSKQKVAVLSGNVKGYEMLGMKNTVAGAFFKFTVQAYKKKGTEECFKLVTIQRFLEIDILEQVKISCDYEMPQSPKGAKVRFEAVIFEKEPSDVTFVIKDGVCFNRHYGKGKAKEDKQLTEQECDELTKRTKAERISGYLPGTEPLTAEDIAIMDTQIVAVLKGSIKDFKETKSFPTLSVHNFQVNAKEYMQEALCVKVIYIKRTDIAEPFDEIKISCKVTEPVITNDESVMLNYGNIIFIRDWNTVVYIIKGGGCLQRSYHFQGGKVIHDVDTMLSLQECYQLTRLSYKRRKSGGKLNKKPLARSITTPGFMWLLTMSGNTADFNPTKMDEPLKDGVFEIQTQQFLRGDEDCIRLLIIRVNGAEVERVTVSCGPTKNLMLNAQGILYGKAFSFKPQLGTDDFIGVYNLVRDGSCYKITYTIERGDPPKLTKSKPTKVLAVEDNACKDLIEGNTMQVKAVSPPFQACASLGWFGGAFTRLISSFGS